MKKIIKFIFLFICFSFFTVVKAENYKTDNNGMLLKYIANRQADICGTG